MSIRIQQIINKAEPDKEYVQLVVQEDTNLKWYAIGDRTFDEDGRLSDVHRHVYRFPEQEVIEGDIVYLITGKGDNTFRKDADKTKPTKYFYYMNLGTCVWNDDAFDSATLWRVRQLQVYKVRKNQK